MRPDNALLVSFQAQAVDGPAYRRWPATATGEDFCGIQPDERARFQRNPVRPRQDKPQIRQRRGAAPLGQRVLDFLSGVWLLAWLLAMAGWVGAQVMEVLL